MKTMDDRWEDVLDACGDAVAITWDGCHKIYVLMDDEQVELMTGYGYDPIIPVVSDQLACETLREWYDESCWLRFISAVRSVDTDPNDGFTSLIGQFDDEEEWDEDEDD